MANTLRFKRGLVAGIPTAALGEPLFTTDTFDLYIGNGTTNTRFQKYIASGATTQILRGDGSLYTFPLAISSPSNGQVLKYNGTSWVNDSDSGITGSGSAGQVAYFTGATTQAGSNNLFWDSTNAKLGIGTNTPSERLQVLSAALSTAIFTNTGTDGGINVHNNGTLAITRSAQLRLVNGTTTFGASDRTYQLVNIGRSGSAADFYVQYWDGSNYFDRFRLFATGNFGIGTGATDSGQRLQVNGTALISGNTTISLNQNAPTILNVSNTTNNTGALTYIRATSSAGSSEIGKFSASTTAYKIIAANNGYLLNSTVGDLAILNDVSGGSIKFAVNGSSTTQMVLTSSGNLSLIVPTYNASVRYGFGNPARTDDAAYIQYIGVGDFTGHIAFGTNASTSNVAATEKMRLFANGNLVLNSTTDSGEKLQVTGTMKVTGASSFGGNMTLSLNQNAETSISVANTTNGTGSSSRFNFSTSGSAGSIGKYSPLTTAYKTIAGSDLFLYNGSAGDITILNDFSTGGIKFAAGGSSTTQMLLNASGNLGLGVTPSAWGSTWRAIDLENSSGGQAIAALYPMIIANGYNTGGGFFYKTTSQATYYQQIVGQHRWFNAPSGTAGNAITFTQAMTLDASGNLLLGSTSSSGERLQVTGTAKITDSLKLKNGTTSSLALNFTLATTTGLYANDDGVGTNLKLQASGQDNQLVLYRNGNLGVGIAIPDARLRVAGAANSTQAIFGNIDGRGLQISTSLIGGTNEAGVVLNARSSVTSGTFIFQTDGTQRMQLDSAGLEFPNNKGLLFENASASPVGSIKMGTGVTNPLEITNGTHTVTLATLGTFISSNLLIGASTIGTSATNTIAVVNGTAPSSSATDIFHLYSADVTAGNAAPHFRTENGAVIKLYQETTSVGNSIISLGGGNAVLDDTTFDGYTLRQIVRALRNQGILQ